MKEQHIIGLEIQAIKRITAFKAEFDPANPQGTVILSGDNEAGKSSVLDAIEMALAGKVEVEPIRRGSDKGQVIVRTEDLVVTRKFTKAGSYLEVAGTDARAYKSPQTMLSRLITLIGFDPLAFSQMKEREQAAELLRVCPVAIDLVQNATEAKRLYDERRDANREVERLKAHVASLPKPDTSPPQPVSVTELNAAKNARLAEHQKRNDGLNAELEKLREQERGHVTKRQELKNLELNRDNAIASRKNNLSEVHRLRKELNEAESHMASLAAVETIAIGNVGDLKVEIDTLPDLIPAATEIKNKLSAPCDVADLDAKIADAEKTNAAAAEAKQRTNDLSDSQGQLEDALKQAQDLDAELQVTTKARENALRAAKFPVPGLGISEEGTVLLNSIPFSQSSTAQKIKLGVALAAAANPTLRVAFVRDGSLLDAKSMATLREQAAAHNLQIWIERIEQDPGAIRIEDGTNLTQGEPCTSAKS